MDSAAPKTLPASWYTSKPLYQLERRAVFLKAWYLVGPAVKFAPGAPVDYEFSGIKISIHRDGEEIKATSSTGESLRTHTTQTGLCFATISGAAPSFDEYFPGLEDILKSVDFSARPYRRSIKYPGHFNWKTMVDGYQGKKSSKSVVTVVACWP